jgi:hypothetical protein
VPTEVSYPGLGRRILALLVRRFVLLIGLVGSWRRWWF